MISVSPQPMAISALCQRVDCDEYDVQNMKYVILHAMCLNLT